MWLGPACAYIELNAPTTSVCEVAIAVRVSPARLLGGFRHFLGFTPSEFLEELSSRAVSVERGERDPSRDGWGGPSPLGTSDYLAW